GIIRHGAPPYGRVPGRCQHGRRDVRNLEARTDSGVSSSHSSAARSLPLPQGSLFISLLHSAQRSWSGYRLAWPSLLDRFSPAPLSSVNLAPLAGQGPGPIALLIANPWCHGSRPAEILSLVRETE